MRGRRRTATWRVTIVGLAFPLLIVALAATGTLAAPSQDDVEAAKARLLELQRRFELIAERYNEARYELSVNEERLAGARANMRSARAVAEAATDRLAERAVAAYMGTGSQVDGLLGAGSVAEFSDRLEFMGAVSATDAEIAVEAERAGQAARWAADEYQAAVAESRSHLAAMSRDREELERLLDEQEAIYEQLQIEYESFLEAQRAAAERAAAAEALEAARSVEAPSGSDPGDAPSGSDPVDAPSGSDPGDAPSGGDPGDGPSGGDPGDDGTSGGGGYVPPVNATKAQIAVQAAYSIVGTQYVWGSSDPSVGLDCSGVTVYAWRQAGVSLPHSAAAQYSMYPRISLSAVQPGDLVYYGNFGPHIAIYVGGGRIIHASSPAPGGQARVDSMYGYDDPWGAVRVT